MDYHPHEWKTHLGNMAKVCLVLGGLWFAATCWNTYTEAMTMSKQLEQVHYDPATRHYLLN